MVYRIIGGIGVGIASMISPMYIAEIAPAGVRGKLVSWNQFAIIFGMLVIYFVNYFIARQGNEQWLVEEGWRWMFFSGAIPAGIFLVLLFFVPETPRYLVMKGTLAFIRYIFIHGYEFPISISPTTAVGILWVIVGIPGQILTFSIEE